MWCTVYNGNVLVKGNVVKNFKVVGNDYGFSFTLHFSHAELDIRDTSPLSTPGSKKKKRKSPSSKFRDMSRQDLYMSNMRSDNKQNNNKESKTNIKCDTNNSQLDPNQSLHQLCCDNNRNDDGGDTERECGGLLKDEQLVGELTVKQALAHQKQLAKVIKYM